MNSWVEGGFGQAGQREAGERKQRAARQGKGIKRRFFAWVLSGAALFLYAFFQPFAHWNPSGSGAGAAGQKQELYPILQHKSLSRRDYGTILQQTGLGEAAVKKLGDAEILEMQDFFLKKRRKECSRRGFFTKQDRAVLEERERVPLISLEDGDIFLSFSSHTLGWKHGHAGLVTDAEEGLCLEAVMPGYPSKIKSLRYWTSGTDFVLLRLKGASKEERGEIAEFARKNLQGVPYSLLAGIFDRREGEDCRKMTAQCAYLIWYAFMQFGYDLDGDGGRLVTVEDLLESPGLELVQTFGTDPKRLRRESGSQAQLSSRSLNICHELEE